MVGGAEETPKAGGIEGVDSPAMFILGRLEGEAAGAEEA